MNDSMYSYQTYESASVDPNVAAGALLAFTVGYLILVLVLYVIMSIFLGKIFKKAGVPAWIAWVPIYNNWKLLQIGGQPAWWAILALIPIVNLVALVFMFIAMYNIGLKLGQSGAFVILAILLTPVWVIWLGVDHSTWDESQGAKRLDTPENPPTDNSQPPQTPSSSYAPPTQPTPPTSTPPSSTPPTSSNF